MAHLMPLGQLQKLYLLGTMVTDGGLGRLAGLNQLQLLELTGAPVTDAGLKRLKKALPDCRVMVRSMNRICA